MKICFFGNISSALKGQTPGGAELQMCLLARALALKGHEVVIIDPAASESFITSEGVKLVNIPNWNKGWRGIRLFLYRIPALWKILTEQHADYYYVRMRAYLHLIPYLIAKKTGGKGIKAIACDLDVLCFTKKFNYGYKKNFNLFRFLTVYMPNDLVNNYLLKKSDYVILQHSGQKLHPGSVRGKMVVFPNIIDCSNLPIVKNPSKSYFIYVGTLTLLKGADKLYELINRLDRTISIIIVGQPDGEKAKEIYEELRKKKNVILKGWKNHKETLELISNAKALINTSYYEGFPNVYIEAWATGIPVISLTVDPGNIFHKYNLGVCCKGDLKKMKAYIESYKVTDFDKDKLISYVHKFHDFDTAADRFLNAIEGLNTI